MIYRNKSPWIIATILSILFVTSGYAQSNTIPLQYRDTKDPILIFGKICVYLNEHKFAIALIAGVGVAILKGICDLIRYIVKGRLK